MSSRAAAGLSSPLEVHLEVETGLGRGGVLPEAVAAAIAVVRASPGVRLGGVWTHLAAADDAANARGQDERFTTALGLVDAVAWGGGPEAVRRHLAGSGGVLGAQVARWDSVRTGIAVYGLVPDALVPPPAMTEAVARLRPVMTLKARPVRVLELPAGHGVSYGPTYVTTRPTTIATLPVGYGDGWRRALSDRADALVRGVRVPLVGRVAMDAVMADVTDVPGAPVTEDDEFVLLGTQAHRAHHRPRAGVGLWDDQLRDRDRDVPSAGPGVPCRRFCIGSADAHGWEVRSDAHRALERRHLRPGGRCDREPRHDVAVDVDGHRGRDQARGRRCHRVRGDPPGTRRPR